MMREWLAELRLAGRRLFKAPAFALGVVSTLGLGIGAATSIFSVASGALLRPLPYPDAGRLVFVGQAYKDGLAAAGEPKFLFWREKSRSFEALACYSQYGGASGNLAGGTEAEFARGLRVSEDFFKAMGVRPALGRSFASDEDAPGGPRVAVISDALWRRRFGGDVGVVGRRVTLNDAPLTVIGVMPRDFRMEGAPDLFLPMQARPTANYDPNATVVGRLKPGVSLEQARSEMRLIADQYRLAFPGSMDESESIQVQPYQEILTEGVARVLWILLGAVSFLLLIACANVAHLQVSRAAARHREFAVRAALGGGMGRLSRQLVAEGLVVSLGAAAVGMLLASAGVRLLMAVMPASYLPDVAAVSFDWRVFGFAISASILTGVISGLAPLWQARRMDVITALKESPGKGGTGRGRFRSLLVVTELALSLSLIGAAGLLTRTFANLLGAPPGFDPSGVLTFQMAPSGARYATTAATVAFYREALERISRLAGVEAAGITNKLPLDWQFNMPVVFSDQPTGSETLQVRMVSPDYFRALAIPLRSGRGISSLDDASTAAIAVVNEAFARKFLGGRPPFARRLSIGRGLGDPVREIVGVVGDARQSGLDRPAPPTVFVPLPQVPDRLLGIFRTFTSTHFVVRMAADAPPALDTIRRELAAIDPTLAISGPASMQDVIARSIAPQRFQMTLLSTFGLVALILALIGVYGVISHTVSEQRREIGVRMALGARPEDVTGMVVAQGMRLALAGLGLGVVVFIGVSGVLESLLYEVSARDPLVLLITTATQLATALMASYLPARRASAADPVEALRAE
ncbi:MAG: ABC transporter permease [Vicinamibacteria bacterium]|nr:ABC transporter permease [Vicinamibacteria bacterium]